jgi:hypothetical protein
MWLGGRRAAAAQPTPLADGMAACAGQAVSSLSSRGRGARGSQPPCSAPVAMACLCREICHSAISHGENPTGVGKFDVADRRWPVAAKPEVIREWLPSPWQLDPVQKGPLRGANFFVVLVARIRDDDPQGKPRSHGADRIVNFVAPAKHLQTGQTVSVILSGSASASLRGTCGRSSRPR